MPQNCLLAAPSLWQPEHPKLANGVFLQMTTDLEISTIETQVKSNIKNKTMVGSDLVFQIQMARTTL